MQRTQQRALRPEGTEEPLEEKAWAPEQQCGVETYSSNSSWSILHWDISKKWIFVALSHLKLGAVAIALLHRLIYCPIERAVEYCLVEFIILLREQLNIWKVKKKKKKQKKYRHPPTKQLHGSIVWAMPLSLWIQPALPSLCLPILTPSIWETQTLSQLLLYSAYCNWHHLE